MTDRTSFYERLLAEVTDEAKAWRTLGVPERALALAETIADLRELCGYPREGILSAYVRAEAARRRPIMSAYEWNERGPCKWIEPRACALRHDVGGNIPFTDCKECEETRSHTWRHLVKGRP